MTVIPLSTPPVTLHGYPVTVFVTVPERFKLERLEIYTPAVVLSPTWIFTLLRALNWIRVPWLTKRWSDRRNRYVRRPGIAWPFRHLHYWLAMRAHTRELTKCRVRNVIVDHVPMFAPGAGSVPAYLFHPQMIGLDFPLVDAGTRIEVILEGTGGPYSVTFFGRVPRAEPRFPDAAMFGPVDIVDPEDW